MAILITLIIYLFTSLPLLKIIQIKEYFFPSIWAHFDYPSSWRLFFKKREIILGLIWVALIAMAITGIRLPIPSIWSSIAVILFVILLLKRKNFLKSFNWTSKFIFINFLVLLFIFRIIQYSNLSLLTIVFLLTKLGQFPIILISTFFGNLITKIFTLFLYKKAHKKILKFKQKGGKIIGVTGSYGKSSIKELLSQLLSVKYRILKSPLRLNAEIGLSQFVINSDLENIEYLIIEMGARAVGEIKTMVNVFEPDIVYLTGLAPQHIATFGSIEKIIKAKLEIFGREQQTHLAILNGNDELIKDIFSKLNISNKYLYGLNGQFYYKNEQHFENNTKFIFVYPGGEIEIETNLIASHQLENLSAALAGCYLLGIKPRELQNKVKNLELLPHSYQILRKEAPMIIDDSYNANLIGCQKGAEYFLNLPLENKIIIFSGILELGTETSNYYKELIEAFQKANKIFLTFSDFSEIFLEKLPQTEIINNEKFEQFYKELPKENSGILILGRVPNWVFKILK